MFEMMLMSLGPRKEEIPNSGLGPTRLIAGDATNGYFGTVQGTTSFTPAEVAALGPISGTLNTEIADEVWCKFVYQGKILLIARQPFLGNILFNAIYNAGMAYGTDGPGNPPLNSTAVNQNKIISRVGEDGKTYRYRVRLIRGFTVDPTSTLDTAVDSEYRLLENVIQTNGNPIKWPPTLTAVVGYSAGIWLMEAFLSGTNRWTAGGNSNYLFRQGAQITSSRNWRPCLELIVE